MTKSDAVLDLTLYGLEFAIVVVVSGLFWLLLV
jgi:hypothetical protein